MTNKSIEGLVDHLLDFLNTEAEREQADYAAKQVGFADLTYWDAEVEEAITIPAGEMWYRFIQYIAAKMGKYDVKVGELGKFEQTNDYQYYWAAVSNFQAHVLGMAISKLVNVKSDQVVLGK